MANFFGNIIGTITGLPAQIKTIAIAAVVAIALSGGTFVVGYVKGVDQAKVKEAQYEQKVVTKTNTITQKEIQYIPQVVTKYLTNTQYIQTQSEQVANTIPALPDKDYYLSNGWIDNYNKSIGANTNNGSLDSKSSVTPDDALATINDNNKVCLDNTAQLSSLQDIITKYNNAIDETNKGK